MPISNNIVEYAYFWPSLLGTVRTFVNTKVSDLGSILLDRDMMAEDVAMMQKIKLKDMEFVFPNEIKDEKKKEKDVFIIKDKEGNSIDFSNRFSTRNEIRGPLLRKRLMQLLETEKDLTLYAALEKIYLDIEHADLFKGFMISLYTEGHPAHPRYQRATAQVAKSMVSYLRQNPGISDDALLQYGKNEMASFFHERDGLELLEDTLGDKSEQTKALGRVLLAMKQGELRVSGQLPDSAYPIGEYLIHGGRIKFDVSELSQAEQQEFFDFITNKQATTRNFASHRASGVDASGSPAETKSGILGAMYDAFQAVIGSSKHYGINLPIGSADIPNKEGDGVGQYPQANGEWGHMYLHKDQGIVLVGVEASAPGKKNSRTNEAHSLTGATGEKSPFLQEKINTKELRNKQISQGHSPLSTKEKNNWASVKITPGQFRTIKEVDVHLDNDYTSLVKDLPKHHAPAKPNRFAEMEQWAKATKQGNKTHWGPVALKVFGGLLAVAGLVIALIPIPGLTQLLGGWLASIGSGLVAKGLLLSAGIAATGIGFGINQLGKYLDPGSNAPQLYTNSKAATKVESPTSDQEFSYNPESNLNPSDQKLDKSSQNNNRLQTNEAPKAGEEKALSWVMHRTKSNTRVDERQNSSSSIASSDFKKSMEKGREEEEPVAQKNNTIK